MTFIKKPSKSIYLLKEDGIQQLTSLYFLRYLFGLKLEVPFSILEYQGQQLIISYGEILLDKPERRECDFHWSVKTFEVDPKLYKRKDAICMDPKKKLLK